MKFLKNLKDWFKGIINFQNGKLRNLNFQKMQIMEVRNDLDDMAEEINKDYGGLK